MGIFYNKTTFKVHRDAQEIPVKAKVDVLVCGGGPAGIGAALGADRLWRCLFFCLALSCFAGPAGAQGVFLWPGEPFDLILPAQGGGAAGLLLDIDQGQGPPATGIFGPLSHLMGLQAALHVIRHSGVQRPVAAQQHIDIPGHIPAPLSQSASYCSTSPAPPQAHTPDTSSSPPA